ncbi:hypothetical protein LCGC14_2123910 [marine sediment metagenome]|uniref:Uncharacterized protein n=1 Tax=marine sediment metagenome TaxID=412755 RepID=A0A0F9E3D6_9ZZZZ
MGQQIIKQPNGKYALWSSVVDDFTLIDATRDQIIEEFVERAEREIVRLRVNVAKTLDKIDAAEPAYMQFTLSFDEAVAFVRHTKGDDAESLKLLNL